jgi:hypothetical protein
MNYKVIAKEGLKLPYRFFREDTVFDSSKVVADKEYLSQLVAEKIIVALDEKDEQKEETKDKPKGK